jgi:hypothetical protein
VHLRDQVADLVGGAFDGREVAAARDDAFGQAVEFAAVDVGVDELCAGGQLVGEQVVAGAQLLELGAVGPAQFLAQNRAGAVGAGR